MRITDVTSNNRRKTFLVSAGVLIFEFPYARLKIKPTRNDPISKVYIDEELGGHGFGYELRSGRGDTVLLEEVRAFNEDPDIVREEILYELTSKAQAAFARSKLTKRALARRLAIPPAQLYRLLDQSFYGKSIDQMIRLLGALGQRVTIRTSKAA